MPTLIKRSRRKGHLAIAGLSLLLLISLIWGNGLSSYFEAPFLSLHTILEIFPLAAHFAIFTVGLLTFKQNEKTPTLFISVTALSVLILDLGHTLSYPGMANFLGASSVDKSIYFWILGRITEALAFMLVAVSYRRNFKLRVSAREGVIFAICWGLIWYILFGYFESYFPEMFSRSHGLSTFKVILEVVTVLIWIWTGVTLYRASFEDDSPGRLWLSLASFTFALSGVFFCSYESLGEFNILLGHLYKLIAVFYIYRAMLYDCVTRPLVDLKKLALRESHQSESKSRFIASIGHELRTPLGVIAGFSDILLMSKDLDQEAREWVGTIKNSSEQIRLIINDLLDLSKAESNSLTIQKKLFDLGDLIGEIKGEIGVLPENKGLVLKTEIAPELHQFLKVID